MVRIRGLLLGLLIAAPVHALECPDWLMKLGAFFSKSRQVTEPTAEVPKAERPPSVPEAETFGLPAEVRETLGLAYDQLLDKLPGGRDPEVLGAMLKSGNPLSPADERTKDVMSLRRALADLSQMVATLQWDREGVEAYLLGRLRDRLSGLEVAERKAALALLPDYSVDTHFIGLHVGQDSRYVWGLGLSHDLSLNKTVSLPGGLGLGPATLRNGFFYNTTDVGTLERYPLKDGVPILDQVEVLGEVDRDRRFITRHLKESPDGRYLVVRLLHTRLRGSESPDYLLVHDLTTGKTFRTLMKPFVENYDSTRWGIVPTTDGSLRLWEYESEHQRLRTVSSVTPGRIKADREAFYWNIDGKSDLGAYQIHWAQGAPRPVVYHGSVALLTSITAAEKKKGVRSEKIELLRANEHRMRHDIVGSALHPTEPWLVLLKKDNETGRQRLDYINVSTGEWGSVRSLPTSGHETIQFTPDGYRLILDGKGPFAVVRY